MKTEESLSSLMAKAQKGDEAAYAKLLTAAGKLVEAFLRRRLNSPQAVEDLVQDILLNVHRARHSFDPTLKFEPWLMAISRNRMNDFLRSMKRKLETLVDEDKWVDRQAESEISQIEIEAFEKAMSKLTPDQKNIVTLLKLEGMSLKEAAAEMNMSESAVKVAAHRGYKALFKELEL